MGNPFLQGLVTRLHNRYAIDRTGMTVSQWIEANTLLKKRPFSFAGYDFQRRIVDDTHPNLDVIKVSQIGMTEIQVRKALSLCVRNNGIRGIFTMPNEKMFKRISKTRIQPIVDGSPVFQPEGSEKWTRSMDLMQFDQSFMYITGATEGDATSIDADFVFNDEVDLTDQQMLALFNSRMQNSSYRISQRFSTPSHVGFGIDKGFGASDQHEYMCRCNVCNHHNVPDFDTKFVHLPGLSDNVEDLSHIDARLAESLSLDEAYIKCERCGAPLDLDDPDIREWVPRYPSRSDIHRGYYVRPFVTSRLDVRYVVEQLLKYKQKDYLRGWYNTVLGKAYTDSNSRITEADIRVNFQGAKTIDIGPDDPCFLGIDVGLVCHVVTAKMSPAGFVICEFLTVPADEIEGWVAAFAESHNLISGAMDRHPYTPTANAVFEASGGKVYPVEYRGARDINPVKNQDDEIRYFQANRTALIDEVAKRVRKHTLPMGGYGHYDHVVIEHMRDMVRDEKPEAEATWIKLNGNDHYLHAVGFVLFSLLIVSMMESLNEADTRTMVGVFGIDMKSSGSALYGKKKPVLQQQTLFALAQR